VIKVIPLNSYWKEVCGGIILKSQNIYCWSNLWVKVWFVHWNGGSKCVSEENVFATTKRKASGHAFAGRPLLRPLVSHGWSSPCGGARRRVRWGRSRLRRQLLDGVHCVLISTSGGSAAAGGSPGSSGRRPESDGRQPNADETRRPDCDGGDPEATR
jgi:hypothetical protein